jgi:S1-C subfamily serine protease
LNELLRKCYEILGLNENASEDEINRAFSRLRDIRHGGEAGAEAEGEAEPWEKLKEIAWARDTLLDFSRTNEPLPAPRAGREATAGGNSAPLERPVYRADAGALPDHGRPWWWSSVGVIALAFLLSGLFYAYKPAPHKPKHSEIIASARNLPPVGQAVPWPSTTQPPAKETPQLLQDVKKAVVTLRFGTRLGSGFLVSEDGYLVTNFHVVDGVKGSAQFSTGETVDVNVVEIAPDKDFALLKTSSGRGYHFLPLGDSSACREGDAVIAIGSPQGLQSTFTKGIVSAKDRRFAGSAVSFIQTDAAINHGNSGGPLINAAGEVIGINTGTVEKFVAEGLNFAIAINDVKGLIEDGRNLSETERAGEAIELEARIGQEVRKREAQEQQSREQIVNSMREEERRYGEQLEAMKEHLEKMQKRQALNRCLGEVARQAEHLWDEQCETLSRPARCQLPESIANGCKDALLNAQGECLKYYGE